MGKHYKLISIPKVCFELFTSAINYAEVRNGGSAAVEKYVT